MCYSFYTWHDYYLQETNNRVGSKGGRGWDEPSGDSQHSSKGQAKSAVDPYSSDVEDDPFFDDPVPVSNTAGLQAIR